ncbi:FUSC family protein [Clostridium cylindrosporum]|uniref:Putative membrane protein n=1 Tax=Clostridium cylindrosporum DSM 605 TaxID=1121307 RepID=A0A0J8D7L5_CLOCY|nr:FUSC family protein [Clostridium cylindrosporum]KMT21882.1 putative membrane protein [Clostridium cylindrosporum DSM 605]
MNRKTIISKTILFICIVGFITIFMSIFSKDNTLVGVTVVTATLMFLQRDLTHNLGRFFLVFLVINISQGMLAYISQVNIWIGIPATFVAMFITGFMFTYNVKAPMYIAFGLQYLFMLYYPVTIDRLPLRVLSLAVGAVIIILAQLIFNRNKLKKVSKATLPRITKGLSEKIDLIIKKKYKHQHDMDIILYIKELRKAILDSREAYFHTTLEGKINLNISIALERINILVDRINSGIINKPLNITLKDRQLLTSVMEIVSQLDICIEDKEVTHQEIEKINAFISTYAIPDKGDGDDKLNAISKNHLEQILEIMDFIRHNLEEVINLSGEEYRKIIRKTDIPKVFRAGYVMRKNFHLKSVKLSYALRSAVVVTLGYFIVKYFNLPEGRWLVFTLFALIQPYMQDTEIKTWHRIKGTLVGVIVFIILFSLVKDFTLRSVIVLLVGYINSFLDKSGYDKQMIFITISALGVAAITGDIGALATERIVYVLIGVLIALIANRLILPYRVEDALSDLLHIYSEILDRIKMEISLAHEGKGNIQNMRNLIMQTSLLEDKIFIIIDTENERSQEKIKDYIVKNRILVNDLYDEYLAAHSAVKV